MITKYSLKISQILEYRPSQNGLLKIACFFAIAYLAH